MQCVTENVAKIFKERESKVLQLIVDSGIEFEEVGIFGSYARNDYKGTSDIDFCVVIENRPSREITGSLREDADMLGADIIFITPEAFKNGDARFTENLRRDYRRIL